MNLNNVVPGIHETNRNYFSVCLHSLDQGDMGAWTGPQRWQEMKEENYPDSKFLSDSLSSSPLVFRMKVWFYVVQIQ